MSRFEDGNRHEVYKVSFLDVDDAAEDLVVRVSLGDDPAERAQAEREARVLEKVGGLAAPRLRDFRLTSPWFAMPVLSMWFVPGRQLELSSATAAEIERLGAVVAWIHGQPVDDLAEWLSETRHHRLVCGRPAAVRSASPRRATPRTSLVVSSAVVAVVNSLPFSAGPVATLRPRYGSVVTGHGRTVVPDKYVSGSRSLWSRRQILNGTVALICHQYEDRECEPLSILDEVVNLRIRRNEDGEVFVSRRARPQLRRGIEVAKHAWFQRLTVRERCD
jgi:hypothetical protein